MDNNEIKNNEVNDKLTKKNKILGTIMIFLVILVVALISYLVIYLQNKDKEDKNKDNENNKVVEKLSNTNINTNIKSLATETTKLEDNSIWTPTLQIIWNDFINEDVKKDVEFINDKDNETVKLLNAKSFQSTDISDSYLYHKFGFQTPELKKEIELGIKTKFNQESDILDSFSFEDNSKSRFFYSMLYREFTFKKPFDILSEDLFGIDKESDNELNNNVEVIFYSNSSYAVKLLTNEGDEVILYKGDKSNSFIETYNNVLKLQEENNVFNTEDTLTIHNIDIKVGGEYKELIDKVFLDSNNEEKCIDLIKQVTSISLDNEGGKVKSEAGMSIKATSISPGRTFTFIDDYMIFIKEKSKDKPYFAANITNIDKFSK